MTTPDRDALEPLTAVIAAETARAVAPELAALAAAVRDRFGGAVAAILLYGSCLRTGTLEGVVDLYVLVDGYRATYRRAWLALANRLLPPNVFFLEAGTIRAKAAVMSLRAFTAACGASAFLPSIWSRFSQPVALLWARDEAARAAVHRALATAVVTTAAEGAALVPTRTRELDLWRAVIAAGYRAELRVERASRADDIVAAAAERYAALTLPALDAAGIGYVDSGAHLAIDLPERARSRARRRWGARRIAGKLVNVMRLVKAALTVEGGLDYLAWKIERHSGVRPRLTPWQRRHPILAVPWIALRLWRRGVIR
jgi:hypothetical protein